MGFKDHDPETLSGGYPQISNLGKGFGKLVTILNGLFDKFFALNDFSRKSWII